MSRAPAPRRTVLKGTLDFLSPDAGVAISVPVFVYKKSQELKKVDAHLYHEADHGRISYRKVCQECERELLDTDIVKLVETGSGKVPVEKEEIEESFNKTGPTLKVIASVPLGNITDGILGNAVMPKDVYMVRAFKTDSKKPPLATHENMLRNLFAALTENGEALIVSACLDTIQRNCLMLPNGDLWTLSWAEEIRENIPFHSDDEIDNEMVRGWKTFLKTREINIDEMESAEAMVEEIEQRLVEKLPEAVAAPAEKVAPAIDLTNKIKEALNQINKPKKKEKVSAKK